MIVRWTTFARGDGESDCGWNLKKPGPGYLMTQRRRIRLPVHSDMIRGNIRLRQMARTRGKSNLAVMTPDTR